MCRNKEDGGRRCPHETNPVAVAERNAKRRAAYNDKKAAVSHNSSITSKETLTLSSPKDYGFQEANEVRMMNKTVAEQREESVLELKHLSRADTYGIRTFASSSYEWINQALYGHGNLLEPDDSSDEEDANSENLRKVVDSLDSAFMSAPLKERITYRGKSVELNQFSDGLSVLNKYVDEKYAIGSEVVFDGYQSTSANPVIASRYAGDNGIVFEMKSGSGLNITSKSDFDTEVEVLLPRATRWKIVGASKGEDYRTHDLHTRYGNPENTFQKMVIIQLVEVDQNGNQLTERIAPPPLTKTQVSGNGSEED